jgi:hypothetical protein
MVIEAISLEFRTGCPWEMLYADDLVITTDSVEELSNNASSWKKHLEAKGLRVNMEKTKVMCSGKDLDILQSSWKSWNRSRQELNPVQWLLLVDTTALVAELRAG